MLTDVQVRKAEVRSKSYKLFDQRGLHVFITPKGHKSWRLKYTYQGKEKLLVLGSYPNMSLKDARDEAEVLHRHRREGKDPALEVRRRKLVQQSAEHTFKELALRWYKLEEAKWRPVHAKDVLSSLEKDIFPDLGAFPLAEIDRLLLLSVLQKVEARGAIETAHRIRQRCEAVFNLGITLGICRDNPAAGLGGAMQRKPVQKRWPALTTLPEARQLLRDIDTAGASPITRAASRLLALTAQRPGMVQKMKWDQVTGVDWDDLAKPVEKALWTIPAEEMKLEVTQRSDESYDHDVPLAPASVELLRAIRTITGSSRYVFPSGRGSRSPMSENALNFLYKRVGYKGRHVPHGWRSSFSTIMNEAYDAETATGRSWRAVIDAMLAHIPEGESAAEWRYNRFAYAARRRAVAERWADLLLGGAVPVERVITGPRRSSLA